ncbi:alpha/beta fold hydrolase [Streptomyces sp. NBC_01136]|uniref:esterase/lipase family protein n=1 Tax=unclassified Streptomyces TaxID=2593676 RepID=UPI0032536D37|nr:alpha/beta fold hydrolase [Streptomyces sp. NBC_01136]
MARGAVTEAAAVTAALALLPFGAGGGSGSVCTGHTPLPQLPAVHGGVPGESATRAPVLLVHGLGGNRAVLTVLSKGLHRGGFPCVSAMNYRSLAGDIADAAQQLDREVRRLCEHGDCERVHVVGHSLGGLIARYYVQRMGGDARVDTLVTLGAPHQGTWAAIVPAPAPMIRQIRPGSALLAELALPAPGCGTRFVAFHSELDEMVIPSGHARISHPDLLVDNVAVQGVGHLSLLFHRGVIDDVCRVLASPAEQPVLPLTPSEPEQWPEAT